MDSNLLTLTGLDQDTLSLVILQLHEVSRETLFSLLRTNHLLYNATLPFIVHKCTLDFSEHCIKEANERIATWLRSDTSYVLRSIRYLIVVGSSQPRSVQEMQPIRADNKWLFLIKLLEGLGGMKEFTFAYHEPIAIPILEALHTHQPTVGLHIRNWTRRSPDTLFGDPEEMALAASSSLKSIQAHLTVGYPMDLQREAFMHIVALSPNLESYNYSRDEPAILSDLDFLYRRDLNAAEEKRQKLLFKVANPVRKALKAVHDDLELSPGMLKDIPIQWDKLESLSGVSIDHANFAGFDGSIFASLRSLKLDVFDVFRREETFRLEVTLNGFLSSLPSLESLALTRATTYLDLRSLILHHGPTLRSFHLLEFPIMNGVSPTLTLNEVSHIYNSCPLLEDLGLVVNPRTCCQWKEVIYTLLTKNPTLQTLTIYFALDLQGNVKKYTEHHFIRSNHSDAGRECLSSLELQMDHYDPRDRPVVKDIWLTFSKRLRDGDM